MFKGIDWLVDNLLVVIFIDMFIGFKRIYVKKPVTKMNVPL